MTDIKINYKIEKPHWPSFVFKETKRKQCRFSVFLLTIAKLNASNEALACMAV